MAGVLQFKRANTATIAGTTGQPGEIYVNTDTNVIHIMDGTTMGGTPHIGLDALKTIATASTDFADFKSRIASL
jgi:hypothetical protein